MSDAKAKRIIFETVSLHPVIYWNYKSGICSLCRSNILGVCIECEVNKENKEVKCERVKGVCGHIYHEHCISKWLSTQKTCPIDMNKWDVEETLS
jgi:RING-box protein 1